MTSTATTPTKRLYRSCDDRMIAGVAGGIAEYLAVDSTLVRLIVLVLVFSGVGLLLYVVAWIIVPENPDCQIHAHRPATNDLGERAQAFADDVRSRVESEVNTPGPYRNGRVVWGLFLVGLGMLFLVQTLFGFDFGRLWPLFLIALGLAIVFARGARP